MCTYHYTGCPVASGNASAVDSAHENDKKSAHKHMPYLILFSSYSDFFNELHVSAYLRKKCPNDFLASEHKAEGVLSLTALLSPFLQFFRY